MGIFNELSGSMVSDVNRFRSLQALPRTIELGILRDILYMFEGKLDTRRWGFTAS